MLGKRDFGIRFKSGSLISEIGCELSNNENRLSINSGRIVWYRHRLEDCRWEYINSYFLKVSQLCETSYHCNVSFVTKFFCEFNFPKQYKAHVQFWYGENSERRLYLVKTLL